MFAIMQIVLENIMLMKGGRKGHILYDSIYIKCSKQANLQRQTSGHLEVESSWNDLGMAVGRYGVSFREDEDVLKLDCGMFVQCFKHTKKHVELYDLNG